MHQKVGNRGQWQASEGSGMHQRAENRGHWHGSEGREQRALAWIRGQATHVTLALVDENLRLKANRLAYIKLRGDGE